MNPNYAYALDVRRQLTEILAGRTSLRRIRLGLSTDEPDITAQLVVLESMQRAVPVYWSLPLMRLAAEAGAKLDGSATFQDGYATAEDQLWVTAPGAGGALLRESGKGGADIDIALHLACVTVAGANDVRYEPRDAILVMPWVRKDHGMWELWGTWHWDFGDTLTDALVLMGREMAQARLPVDSVIEDLQQAARSLRLILAGSLLTQQRLFVQAEAPIDRTVRKRHNIAKGEPSPVRVVHLRERVYERRQDETDEEHEKRVVEWSCQWGVSGHWRQYVKRAGGKRIWIPPYMKGPASAPLRNIEKLIAVVR